MGNAESSVNGGDDTNYDNDDDTRYDDDYDANDEYAKQFDGIETLGYRVLGVQPGSPASQAGLVSFFDFIVGANQEMLLGSGEELDEGDEYDDVDFPKLLQDNVNGTITLLVWNIKAQEKRIVELSPRTDWGGAGLLGVTIKLDNYGGADEHLIRVLEVDDNESPAKLAGLIPNEDYLLGTTGTALSDTDVLASVLQLHINKVVELYVYNSTTDLVRIVGLHPTFRWGDGYSLFGAAVGQGYLHRLPKSCRSTIGKSIERKVSVHNRDQSLSESNILHEPTLEMEVDDEDVGLANIANHNNNNTRSREAQPHQLGSSMETSTATEHTTPAGSEKYERNDNNSMRSISLKTSYEAPPPVPPMEAFRQPQQQQHGQDPAEQYEGRPQTPPPSIPDARPDPPSCAERTAKTTNNRKNSIQSQQQPQRQHQVEQLDPTPQQNERPSLKDKLFNYVAPIPDPQQTVTETAAVSSPSSLPSSVTGSSSEFSTPHPQRPTMAAAAAATFDSPPPSEVTKTNEQQQHVEKSPPPPPPNMTAFDSSPRPEPTIVSPIPDAAPTAPPLPTPPSPSAGTAPPPPPPPSAVDSNGGAPLPPPPPPPRPPTPPAPDAKNIRHSSHNSSSHYDDDDAGSEYTDGSYTDGEEYTDDEGEEEAPKSGGLFGVFMPAPPKMEY